MTSTIERLRHTAHLTRQQRESIADRFAASGCKGSWGEYLANAAVDHAIAQAHAEYKAVSECADTAEREVVKLLAERAELERRNAELVEALSLARRLFIKYEIAVDVSPTLDHRKAMRIIDAALAHSAQEKADAAE